MVTLESIQSIYPNCADELTILKSAFPTETKFDLCNEGVYVNILVTPGVAGGPVNVCFKLRVLISSEYPHISPLVELLDPVGLSDSDLSKLESDIKDVLHSFAGECMIFPLIDFCREFVSSNIPSVDCSICFEDFQREEDVNRSLCNHFFHNKCLLDYHNNLLSTYQSELGAILQKNPHCPKEMRPILRFPCPLCKTELPPLVDVPSDCV